MRTRLWAGMALALVLTALTAVQALAQGFDFSLSWGNIKSAFRDTSNLLISWSLYRVTLETSTGAGNLHLNAITLETVDWHPDLDLFTPTTGFRYDDYLNGTSGDYTLGDAIAPGSRWEFNAAFRYGSVAPDVADGVYSANLNLYGGDSAEANDLLASFNIALHVAQKLDVTADMTVAPGEILPGQTAQVTMTVTNNMTENFVSTTWYASSMVNEQGNSLRLVQFDGNWFGQFIAPGDSRTDLHSTWRASDTQALGIYEGTHGVVGGLYSGDFHFISGNPVRIAVVPGPGALLVMGAGLLCGVPAVLRGRRSVKQQA
ncbi:MAG: hypothetical protein RMJ43_09900 [Chloroherpetonaceae bacterium]|nr:hypothetical protein [Chthonomonadaceae bacterium]MDW8208139.1 hypothetical protein [Chloroherpetonaceae bacterium]